jgi:hypothetical protein
MNNLDQELRRALAREEPPAGFAERVLERLPSAPSNVVPISARGRGTPRFAFAAAAALAIATAGVWYAIPRGDMHTAAPIPRESGTAPAQGGPVDTTMLFGVDQPEPPPPPKPAPAPRRRARPAPRPSTEDAEALRAAEQLRLALHITGDTLNVARREVRESASVPTS